MRRREFITLLGGAAAAWPVAARAQQPAMPVVGFLRSTPAAPFALSSRPCAKGWGMKGLSRAAIVTIEQRYADNRPDRLPGLAAELVRRQVSVIVGNVVAVDAARAATATIPIVFVTGEDPVKSGLVASLNRPEANLTGVTFFGGSQLNAKQLELLHDLISKTTIFAVLGDINYPAFEAGLPAMETAGRALGLQIVVVKTSSEHEFEGAFAKIVEAGAGALLVSGSPFFTSQRRALVALAARHAIPAIYDQRDFVVDGGLISYSASFTGAYRQAGTYVGKILKGAKPSELAGAAADHFRIAAEPQDRQGARPDRAAGAYWSPPTR